MAAMSRAALRETWLEGLGEWSWPGAAVPAVELVPAAWVPSVPLAVPVPAPSLPARPAARPRPLPRPLRLARLVALVAIGGATFVISSRLGHRGTAGAAATVAPPARLAGPLA